MNARTDRGGLLADVARDARLAEGPEGVRRILRTVFRKGPVPIRDLARDVFLPVPVVAAVRGELEKRGLLTRKGGLSLTDAGLERVRDEVGLVTRDVLYRREPFTLPQSLKTTLREYEALAARRPEADVRLDQSHALPATALKRACYLQEHDGLEGREILILGDDDLTSLAIALVAGELGIPVAGVTVCEVDERLCVFLREVLADAPFDTRVVHADLRAELPEAARDIHDVFFTDPPYTVRGMALFASRGIQGLTGEVGKQGFISFGSRMPKEAAEAIGLLAGAGLAPVEIVPDFNRYVGAQLLAGSSQMIRTVSTGDSRPPVSGSYEGPLYTADRRPKHR